MAELVPTSNQSRMVCGYPKTGRTWLRFILGSYLADQYGVKTELDFNNIYAVVPNEESEKVPGQPSFAYENIVPAVSMSHLPYTPAVHEEANVAFLTRDPRDILVSHWLHNKNQIGVFSGDLSEFIRSDKDGLPRFIRHLESWAPHLDESQVVAYETMQIDIVGSVSAVLRNLRLPIDEAAIETAALENTMDRMRRKELAGGIVGHSYDRTNPEALRVRRGKVGGYADYLSANEEQYIADRLAGMSAKAKAIIELTGAKIL